MFMAPCANVKQSPTAIPVVLETEVIEVLPAVVLPVKVTVFGKRVAFCPLKSAHCCSVVPLVSPVSLEAFHQPMSEALVMVAGPAPTAAFADAVLLEATFDPRK
jgi:hypothetical protein